MKDLSKLVVPVAVALAATFGCDSSETAGVPGSSGAGTPGETTSSSSGGGGSSSGGGSSPGGKDGGADAASGDAGASALADPTKDGPYAIAELDAKTHVAATKDDVPIHCAYPASGPSAGPYPVVVLAHGFQLPAAQYYGYLRRLASFGFVALTADYPASFLSVSNVADADDVSGGIDWALSAAQLAGKVDGAKVGVMGHSRGGKDAVIVASRDARVKAVLGLDPVDSKPPLGCNATTQCPDGSDLVATLTIPTGFLGETVDASGGTAGQSCAPAADNFATFYASAKSKSVSITVVGANHMSFLDDPSSCGLTCSMCNKATAAQDDVLALAYGTTVAFFELHLRGNAAAATWLTGAEAQARWVTPGFAAIASK